MHRNDVDGNIMLQLTLEHTTPTAVAVSPNVLKVAAMFGLGVDEQREFVVVPPIELTIAPHEVVFITGASGSGKSTLLRLIGEALAGRDDVSVVDFAQLPQPPEVALVDVFEVEGPDEQEPPVEPGADGQGLERTLRLLSLAGLNDAFVMLRSPGQLSDGQRYRLRLAQAMDAAERADGWTVVLADEFGAALDRVTTQVIAHNVRKWTRRRPVCFIAATTHDDLLEALEPDCVVEQQLGSKLEIARRKNGTAPRDADR